MKTKQKHQHPNGGRLEPAISGSTHPAVPKLSGSPPHSRTLVGVCQGPGRPGFIQRPQHWGGGQHRAASAGPGKGHLLQVGVRSGLKGSRENAAGCLLRPCNGHGDTRSPWGHTVTLVTPAFPACGSRRGQLSPFPRTGKSLRLILIFLKVVSMSGSCGKLPGQVTFAKAAPIAGSPEPVSTGK